MKKLLLILALVLGISAGAKAQRAEFQLSYGGYTQMDCMDMHDDWHHVNTAWGAVTAGLNFRVMPRLWIGPSYTLSTCSTKGGSDASHIAYHVIMLNGRYEYYRTSLVKLYAHVGIGADISYMQPHDHDNYTKGYFAFHIAPIGAQFDIARNVGMFGELGFGAQGLLQVGFRFGF